MQSTTPKITKVGLQALSKSPSERTSAERRQAKRTEEAIKAKKQLEKQKEDEEKRRIQEGLKPYSKAAGKYKGIKRLAYRVKLFWLVEGSRPKRFYPVNQAIDLDKYDLLKQATIELAKRCIDDYEYGEKAVGVWTILDNPPKAAKRVNIAATCRAFADFVLDRER